MALTQTDELTDDVFPFDRASAAPGQLRKILEVVLIEERQRRWPMVTHKVI